MLHVLNAVLRFALELTCLYALGRWGHESSEGAQRYVLASVLPLIAASVWGVFTVPGDPSRGRNGPVPVSGRVRLALEALFFAAGVWAFAGMRQEAIALTFVACVCLHYVIGHARTRWLIAGGKAPARAL